MAYFFKILKIYIFEFLFTEIPNIIQIITGMFIAIYIVDNGNYFFLPILFTIILAAYLISKGLYFIRNKNNNTYLYFNHAITVFWILFLSTTIVIFSFIFNIIFVSLSVERITDSITNKCELLISLEKYQDINDCFEKETVKYIK
ncbi:MAG TPA: hypothetical protein VK153_03065 [Candidatus Paceibacterota bacterium]|nr:hypothetical protein [Candidatus Paceibacterota bacterium]